jgi:nucleoid DNA-binding protein
MSSQRPNRNRPRKTKRTGSLEVVQYLVHEQGLSKPDAHGIWHGIIDYLRGRLVGEGSVLLQGIGKLEVYEISERIYTHPATGEKTLRQARQSVRLVPSGVVKRELDV